VILAAVTEAQEAGARLDAASAMIGISARTIERWRGQKGDCQDGRSGPRRRPSNALTPGEQAKALALLTSPEYQGLSPKQLVPRLADQGTYVASEATFYRLLRRFGLRSPRRSIARSHVTRANTVHRATGPNQVWSWDITYLPTCVRGRYLYLYLVMDVWSRRIVGAAVHVRESADHAAALVREICIGEGVDPRGLVLHSDNGKPMRGSTMVATLQWLGIVPSSAGHMCPTTTPTPRRSSARSSTRPRTHGYPSPASRRPNAGSRTSSPGTTPGTATAPFAT
jgi:putative transposase